MRVSEAATVIGDAQSENSVVCVARNDDRSTIAAWGDAVLHRILYERRQSEPGKRNMTQFVGDIDRPVERPAHPDGANVEISGGDAELVAEPGPAVAAGIDRPPQKGKEA